MPRSGRLVTHAATSIKPQSKRNRRHRRASRHVVLLPDRLTEMGMASLQAQVVACL